MIYILRDFFTHIFDFSQVFQILCIAFVTVLLLGEYEERISLKSCLVFILEMLIISVVFLAFDVLFYILCRYITWLLGIGGYLMYFCGIILYAAFRSKKKVLSRIIMASVLFSTLCTMCALGTVLGNALEIKIKDFDIAITKIISYLLIVVCGLVFYNKNICKLEINSFSFVLNFICNLLIVAIVMIWCEIRLWILRGPISFELLLFIAVMLFGFYIINIMAYMMTYFFYVEREKVISYQVERTKAQSLKELLQLSEHNLAELREIRHDLKNQYAYMDAMINDKKYDELAAYFKDLSGTFAKPLYSRVDCGNRTVDSILNLELSKAKEAGLDLDVKATIPSKLPFNESGLLSLFTNVIDNSIEACVRDENKGAVIEANITVKGDYLYFCVSNPTKKKDINEEGTSKDDKKLHGYGMKIIKKIVSKYNGYYRCTISDGVFYSDVILDMCYKDKKGEDK